MKHQAGSALFISLFFLSLASPAAADNILPNPTFAGTIDPWVPTSEDDVNYSSEDADGGGSGSVMITPSQPFGAAANVCVPVVGGTFYYIQVDARLEIEGDGFAKTGIQVFWKTDTECKFDTGGLQPFAMTASTAPEWQHMLVNSAAPANAQSAFVQLAAVKINGDPIITAFLDNPSIGTEAPTTTIFQTTTTLDPGEPGCADPTEPFNKVTAADALFILRGSVGTIECSPCFCDTDDSGNVGAGDALRVLKLAVGNTTVEIECGQTC